MVVVVFCICLNGIGDCVLFYTNEMVVVVCFSVIFRVTVTTDFTGTDLVASTSNTLVGKCYAHPNTFREESIPLHVGKRRIQLKMAPNHDSNTKIKPMIPHNSAQLEEYCIYIVTTIFSIHKFYQRSTYLRQKCINDVVYHELFHFQKCIRLHVLHYNYTYKCMQCTPPVSLSFAY